MTALKALAAEAGADAAEDTLLLCLSHLRWDFVYQRPQHLLSRAARMANVVFMEEPIIDTAATTARMECRLSPEGVTIAVPHLPPGLSPMAEAEASRLLVDQLLQARRHTRLITWYYTPMALAFSRHLRADFTIYDCMDELSGFKGASPHLRQAEADLLARADIVFTGGRSLFEAKADLHANLHAFPSSVDAGHFRAARGTLADPAAQAGLQRPRIGFFGVIDERMDLDLLAAMARRRPEWQFVMVGPVVKIDPATLPGAANIAWLGQQPYAQLPAFLANWDVGLMPFALNAATRFISPTKTLEYLAAGVPVVSTPIADVVRPYGEQGLVEIAHDPLAAIAAIEALLARPKARWLADVDAMLARTSWDATWSAMERLIGEAKPRGRTPRPAAARQPEHADA